MSRKFIAAIVALSVTVTGVTASQAEASDKRTRNLIVGAATLAIIGAAISNQNRDDRNSHVGRADTRYQNHKHHGVKPRAQRHSHNGVQPRPLPRRAQTNHLPTAACAPTHTGGGGYVQKYDARCVQNHRNSANNRHYNRR